MSSRVSSRKLTANTSSPRLLGSSHKPAPARSLSLPVCGSFIPQFVRPELASLLVSSAGLTSRAWSVGRSCQRFLHVVPTPTAVTAPAPPPRASLSYRLPLQLVPPVVPAQRRSQRSLCCRGLLRRSCGFPCLGLKGPLPPGAASDLDRTPPSLTLPSRSCLLLFLIALSKASEPPTQIPHIPLPCFTC